MTAATSPPKAEIRIITHGGEIVLSFPEAWQWVGFRPKEARDLAAKLVQLADEMASKVRP